MDENENSFKDKENLSYMRVIRYLESFKSKRQKLVVDMGCGKARISKHFKESTKFEFHNYDHVSYNEDITRCDISCLPEEGDEVNICILCLALMGSNCHDYIKEAYRVLEKNGILIIVEGAKQWQGDEGEPSKLIEIVEKYGFEVRGVPYNDTFIFLECMKK
jgi:ribosomal RNA-processing protein 8